MKKNKNKQEVLIIRITEEEKRMVKELRENESINISAFVRNAIRNYHKESNHG